MFTSPDATPGRSSKTRSIVIMLALVEAAVLLSVVAFIYFTRN